MKLIDRIYGWFVRAVNACQSPLLLAIRLYWGWQFWLAGWGKITNIPRVVEYFTNLGLPAPHLTAYFIAWLEAIGGILLVLGLGSRLIAVPLAIDMFVAYVVADRDALLAVFADPDKFTTSSSYTFLFASLLILSFGPGFFSLDHLIAWYRKKHKSAEAQNP